jgi:hypothetical protein
LFSVAYHLLLEASTQDEEVVKAKEQVQGQLRNIEYESETGLPAITQWMAPADQL